jgi:hypothetical protein
MKLYSVKKGKYYFQGDKFQICILQYALTLIGIVLAIYFYSWLIALISVISFFAFYSFLQSETISDSIRVYFFQNCTYKLTENYDQVNKLYGFSEGFHHWNSARIGWRCTDGENIELLAYCYINGKRVIKPMITCKSDSWVFCNIQNKTNKYVFKALSPNNQSITVSVDKEKSFSYYSLFKLFIYRLFPYFGGKISAPHDMNIYTIRLKTEKNER